MIPLRSTIIALGCLALVILATGLFTINVGPRPATAQNTINVPLNMATTQVSVATSATLVETNRSRGSVTVENLGTNQVCLGPNNAVTLTGATGGVCLPANSVGAAITIPFAGAVWGIANGGADTVAVMDLF